MAAASRRSLLVIQTIVKSLVLVPPSPSDEVCPNEQRSRRFPFWDMGKTILRLGMGRQRHEKLALLPIYSCSGEVGGIDIDNRLCKEATLYSYIFYQLGMFIILPIREELTVFWHFFGSLCDICRSQSEMLIRYQCQIRVFILFVTICNSCRCYFTQKLSQNRFFQFEYNIYVFFHWASVSWSLENEKIGLSFPSVYLSCVCCLSV